MVELNGIYKCEVCGNVVSVLEATPADIICCGNPMKILGEKNKDEGHEKHVPVIETTENGVKVKVGSNPHPMEDKHHIELIQLVKGGEVVIGKRLKSGDKPEAEFCCIANAEGMKARALCNVHGLWKA